MGKKLETGKRSRWAVALVLLSCAPLAGANCTDAARLSGGTLIEAGDHEGRVFEELGPPDRVVSSDAAKLDDVRERLVYYLRDRRDRLETVWFEVQGGRVRGVCKFQRDPFR